MSSYNEGDKGERSADHDENGRFVKGHSHVITTQNAKSMQAKSVQSRKDNRIAATIAGATKSIASQVDIEGYRNLPPELVAVAAIMERQTDLALSGDGHASVKAGENVLKMLDHWPDKQGIKVKTSEGSVEAGSIEELYEIKAWLQAQDDG